MIYFIDGIFAIFLGWSYIQIDDYLKIKLPKIYKDNSIFIKIIASTFLISTYIYGHFKDIKPYLCNKFYECREADQIASEEASRCFLGKCSSDDLMKCVVLLSGPFPQSSYIGKLIVEASQQPRCKAPDQPPKSEFSTQHVLPKLKFPTNCDLPEIIHEDSHIKYIFKDGHISYSFGDDGLMELPEFKDCLSLKRLKNRSEGGIH